MRWDRQNVLICLGLLVCFWLLKEVNQVAWESAMGFVFGDWLFRTFTPHWSWTRANYHFKKFQENAIHLLGGYNVKK